MLADGFFRTFPQLEGLRFSHAWGGLIDTCTRFTAFYGTAMDGRVGYALGFTGLGVAATRFAGDVVLDLLAGEDTPRTRLEMVRSRPLPFPPEPFRWAGIEATTRSLSRADANGGRRTVAAGDGQVGLRLRLVKRGRGLDGLGVRGQRAATAPVGGDVQRAAALPARYW